MTIPAPSAMVPPPWGFDEWLEEEYDWSKEDEGAMMSKAELKLLAVMEGLVSDDRI